MNVPASIRDASAELRKSPFLVSRRMLCDILATYDLLAIVTSGLLARYTYLEAYRGEAMLNLEYASLILVTSILFQLVARRQGLYDTDKVEEFLPQLYVMIYTCATTFA